MVQEKVIALFSLSLLKAYEKCLTISFSPYNSNIENDKTVPQNNENNLFKKKCK